MRKVFADTLYWVAIVRPNDPYAQATRCAFLVHEVQTRSLIPVLHAEF
jgi:hypothetical protein